MPSAPCVFRVGTPSELRRACATRLLLEGTVTRTGHHTATLPTISWSLSVGTAISSPHLDEDLTSRSSCIELPRSRVPCFGGGRLFQFILRCRPCQDEPGLPTQRPAPPGPAGASTCLAQRRKNAFGALLESLARGPAATTTRRRHGADHAGRRRQGRALPHPLDEHALRPHAGALPPRRPRPRPPARGRRRRLRRPAGACPGNPSCSIARPRSTREPPGSASGALRAGPPRARRLRAAPPPSCPEGSR